MTATVNGSPAPSRFEDLFCSAFDAAPPETPNRSLLDLFAVAAEQAGFAYPTKQGIVEKLLDRREPMSFRRSLPITYHFFGNHDYYVRARFHEGRVERDSWTGDVTWDEGAELAFNARSRYDTFKIDGDVWTDGLEVFYGFDVAGLTRRKRRFSDIFVSRFSETDQARLVVPHLAHRGLPTVKVTEGLNLFGLGRSLLTPIPRTRALTAYPDPAERSDPQPFSVQRQNAVYKESFGRRFLKALMGSWVDQDSSGLRQVIEEWFGERSKWVQGPIGTLDDLQITVDSRPPPNHELVGRSYLHLDWQRLMETLKSGRFLKFDFEGIKGDSYANFPKLPASLLIPNAEGTLDLHWSYNAADKTTSIVLSDIDVTLPTSVPLALRGEIEIVLRHPNLAEIYFDNLEYVVENIPTSQLGSLRSSGRLNSSVQLDLSGDKPVLQRSWLEIDELAIGSADGGPIQFQVGETMTGGLVEDGYVSFDYDPDRVEGPMSEEIELRGFAFSHGPKNNLDFSDLVVRVRSPLNLITLKAEAEANLRVTSEGGTPYEVRGIRASLSGVPPEPGHGPHLLVNLQAESVPLFKQELVFDSGGQLWAEPEGNSCRMTWDGHLSLNNQPAASPVVSLATALFGSSDFETIRLKIVPAFEQIFSDWTFRGFTEGEVKFKPEGKTEILNGVKQDSSFRTVRTPSNIYRGGERVVGDLNCVWEGNNRRAELFCAKGSVGDQVNFHGKLLIPWHEEGFRAFFGIEPTTRHPFWGQGALDYRGQFSVRNGAVSFLSRPAASSLKLWIYNRESPDQYVVTTQIEGGLAIPFDLKRRSIRPQKNPSGFVHGEVGFRSWIGKKRREFTLARGIEVLLNEPARIRGGQLRTDTIGGLCFSGFVNPQAASLLGDKVELVQKDGKWFYLKRCGSKLPLTRESLLRKPLENKQ